MLDQYNQSAFLVIKVAYLYYIEEYPQSQIAEQLNISVTTVSRLLKKAKEDKIIEFVIRDSYINCILLEKKLKEKYQLQQVIIAPGYIEEGIEHSDLMMDNVKKMVALEAARYLQRIIRQNDVLGVTWGSHVYNMINYLNSSQKVDATFVTLHGSIACCRNELDVRTLVSRMAKAFSGQNYYLLAESLTSNREICDILKHEKNNARVFEMFDSVNISISGIGSFYPNLDSVLAQPDFMSAEDLQKLQAAGVYGDIALRFFNQEGKECQTDLAERMLAISLEQLKRIKQKITIASGLEKTHTIRSALKGRLIDVLIIDNQLAGKLLN